MGIIFLIIVVLVIILFVYLGKAKSESKGILNEIVSSHKIDKYYITTSGCLAFCDNEKMLYHYSTNTHVKTAIHYDTLILCGTPDESSTLILINAASPKYTQYQFGAQEMGRSKEILSKLEKIIDNNLSQAKLSYDQKIEIPSNASKVKVERYENIDAGVPGGVWTQNTFVWVKEQKLYLMSMFGGLVDYKSRPNVYNPIIIDIKNIVELSQGGDVHYTTNIHGGGGGGSSIKGAVVGGILAGEAGAIIGSRKPTDPIVSTTQKIDDRATHLKVLDSNNNFYEIFFDYNDYYVVSKLINECNVD